MPYQFDGNRRHNYQFGVGQAVWGSTGTVTPQEWLLNMIPGGLAWLSLGVVVYAAFNAPLIMMTGAALLSLYTTSRFALAAIAVRIGLRRVREAEQTDWCAEYYQRANADSIPLEKVHHLVIIPNYKEEIDTL